MQSRKYWYFRLRKEDLFDPKISQMLSIPSLGYMLFTIYVRLCALTINDEGYLRIDEVMGTPNSYTIPLAKMLEESVENVVAALNYLTNRGLVEIEQGNDHVVINLPIVENNIGKSSTDADRKRKNALPNNTAAALTKNDSKKAYGTFNNILLTDQEYMAIKEKSKYKDADSIINIFSANYKVNGLKNEDCFEEIIAYLNPEEKNK